MPLPELENDCLLNGIQECAARKYSIKTVILYVSVSLLVVISFIKKLFIKQHTIKYICIY